MKLLHVIADMDPEAGGVSQAVRTTIAGLAKRGVHNEVANSDAPNSAWHRADLFTTHALGPGRGPWNYSPTLLPWLLNNLSRFDAVILHGLWLYNGYALRKALRGLKHTQAAKLPRLFVMPHGMLDPYFQRATSRKLKAWRNWAYWKLIESHIVNEAAGLLFTCEEERLLAHIPFTPYRPRRELVVGLGVADPPPYEPAMQAAFSAKCPEVQKRPYLLFLSRIHEKKGVDLLLEAYEQVVRALAAEDSSNPAKSSHEQSDAVRAQLPVLVIAGPGLDAPYGQRIKQVAAESTAPANVLFPGMLTDGAKWGAFYGCEAFILPSHQENFGIAVVEALACGKPVLISNQINIWREIEKADGGFIATDTLEGTRQLLENWQKLTQVDKQALGKRARETYREYFATEPAAKKIALALE